MNIVPSTALKASHQGLAKAHFMLPALMVDCYMVFCLAQQEDCLLLLLVWQDVHNKVMEEPHVVGFCVILIVLSHSVFSPNLGIHLT